MSDAPTPAANCPYCLAVIAGTDEVAPCPGCGAVHHGECWTENGGCAVYGCVRVPAVEGRRAIEIPVSFWGQENKPCPACSREILAAAVRCRHCGATFASARPENVAEFRGRAALAERLPEAKRTILWIFALSVIPFLAPIGAVWWAWWHRTHREEVAALPTLYGALGKIGLLVSVGLTVAIAVLTVIYIGVRG